MTQQPRHGTVAASTSNGATAWNGELLPLKSGTPKSLRSSPGSTATTRPKMSQSTPDKSSLPNSKKTKTGEPASGGTFWAKSLRQLRSSQRQAEYAGGLSRLSCLCILAALDMPKPRAAAWLIAAMFLGAAVPLGAFAWHLWPVPNPIQILEHRAYWDDAGHWVVETDAHTADVCTVVVARQFVPVGGGSTVGIPPVAASMLEDRNLSPGSMPYAFQTDMRTGTVRYAYAIKPGQFSQHLIEINAFRCDGGFEGTVGRWIVPITGGPR